MGKSTTKACPQCETEEETVGHFLGQCPAFARARGEAFNSYYLSMTDIFEKFSLKNIITYTNRTKRLLYDPTSAEEEGIT